MAIVYNSVYTALIGVSALRPPRLVWKDVCETWKPAMRASIKFWPAVHLLTFSPVIPMELKLLWIDVMEVLWIAILSHVNAVQQQRHDGRGGG
mmetsp:Transcript_70120/g.123939  ORF Transcript_70120/g.123939 Transcript_70120/m.123939 type:complete len:93 (+) Transcript_70120:85-363(+)